MFFLYLNKVVSPRPSASADVMASDDVKKRFEKLHAGTRFENRIS